MADIRVDRSEDRETITVSGELTVPSAAALKEAVSAALDGARSVVLVLTQVTGADVSFLQILCAAHRASVAMGKELRLEGREEKAYLQAVQRAGFERHVGCSEETRDSCFYCF